MMTELIVSRESAGTAAGALLLALFKNLSADAHRYAVLRGYEGLPDNPGRDVDILVDATWSQKQLTGVMQKVSSETGFKIIRCRHTDTFSKYNFRHSSGEWLEVDLWGQISWRGLKTANASVVLEQSIQTRTGISIVSPGSEAAISFFKEYLPFGQPKVAYRPLIASAAAANGEQIHNVWSGVVPDEVIATILEKIQAQDWDALEKRVNIIRRQLVLGQFRLRPISTLMSVARYLNNQIKNLITPTGFLLCLIGPDGSGKTTTSNALIERLAPAFSGTHYVHGHFGILPRLGKLSKQGIKSEPRTEAQSPRPLPFARALIHVIYYFFDYLLGHSVVARRSGRGQLLLFDRYFYDYFIQQSHRAVPRKLLKFLLRFVPQPDMIVWLRNDAETIHHRKPELSIPALQEQLASCERIMDDVQNGVVVDTNQSLESVVDEIELALFSALERAA